MTPNLSPLVRQSVLAVLSVAVIGGSPAQPVKGEPVHSPDGVPFGVGEQLTYRAKVNFLTVGSASMTLEGIESVRGHAAYHAAFEVNGRLLFFRVNDHYETWFDTISLSSLRLVEHIKEANYDPQRDYEFYPERQVYIRNGEEKPSVAEPLDELSFIYFMRSMKLEVGRTYEFNRYYHPDRNPVVVKVLRREPVKVPLGEFDAIVVEPIIKSKGLFSEGGRAEVWFADDSTRRILKLKSKLSFGTLYLELKSAEYLPRG